MSSTLEAFFHGKESLRQFQFHQRYREQSHFETDVWHIWKVDSRTVGWDLCCVSNHLGKFSMENIYFRWWWRSHQSIACKGFCIFRFCVMPWKVASESNIKYCLWRKVELVQRFTTIQNFGHNWRRADGIRVEYFPRIHHIAALPQSPRVHDQNGRPITIQRTNFLHVDVQWHQWSEDNERECSANATLVTLFARRFPAGRWSFLDLDQKRSGILLMIADHKQNGTETLNWWWSNSEKADTQFSEPRVHCLEEPAQKQRRWKIINTLLCRWGYDWNCSSHNYFC